MDDHQPTSSQKSKDSPDNNAVTTLNRSRSSARKRQLSSNSDSDQIKPPPSRPRSQSVSRQSIKSKSSTQISRASSPVIFKTQGESFNMSKLVQNTLLKPDVCKSIIPPLLEELKSELISDLKCEIKTAVAEAIEGLVLPLRQSITQQENKIQNIINAQDNLEKHFSTEIDNIKERYEKYRNMANAQAICMADNAKLSEETRRLADQNLKLLADNAKLKLEVSTLNSNIEELEQYGRRTSLRFHNVPITVNELQKTDDLVVNIANTILKISPPLCTDDINRSHIIGAIKDGKGQLICRFRNWKIKNAVYSCKKNLKDNPSKIFITEDLTKFRQSLVKELNDLKKKHKISSFWTYDGRIFVKRTQTSDKVIVSTIQDLEEFKNQ